MRPGYTTIWYKNKKQKRTKRKQKQYEAEWHEHNRWCKQKHLPTVSYAEFEEIKRGKKRMETEFRESKEPAQRPPHRRDTPSYPSGGDGIGNAEAKESPVYSGERRLIGIGTMHKSNMVPIFDEESAKDIARMRR